jgi:hypothetical protein
VDGELVGEVAPLGHLDGVDLADEVGDRGVGGGQLLAEAGVAGHPGDGRVVAVGGDEVAGVARHGVVGVVVDLAAGHDRHPLVEQSDQRPDHAGLGLSPLAQQDDVVAGEDGVLDLREDGVLIAHHPLDDGLARRDAGQGVATHLVLDGDRSPTRRPELAQGRGPGRGGCRGSIRIGLRLNCRLGRLGHDGQATAGPTRRPGRR